jgi:zinc and cadmium transporter
LSTDYVLLTYYCIAIVIASIAGGLLPRWLRLSHRRTELIVSFVAGTMLGVAMLHMLPHALAASPPGPGAALSVFRWTIAGFLVMFLIERFFCFHHHEADEDPETHHHDHEGHHDCGHDHSHSEHQPEMTWSGAAMGLTLHTLLSGVALAASVRHTPDDIWLPGLGAFIAIVLHKPLDAMTIAVLMGKGKWGPGAQALVNGLFALAVPAGAVLYVLGLSPVGEAGPSAGVAAGVAFSAGVFLCVAMSDLLPELQFHHHDRIALSAAVLAGLGVAELAQRLETHSHASVPATPTIIEAPLDGAGSGAVRQLAPGQ